MLWCFSEEVIGAIFGAGNCSTYHCYKGGPEEPPAGLETAGCPVYSHPAQLVDNRNCVLCMTCDKARAPQLPLKHSLRLSDSLSYFPPVQGRMTSSAAVKVKRVMTYDSASFHSC